MSAHLGPESHLELKLGSWFPSPQKKIQPGIYGYTYIPWYIGPEPNRYVPWMVSSSYRSRDIE